MDHRDTKLPSLARSTGTPEELPSGTVDRQLRRAEPDRLGRRGHGVPGPAQPPGPQGGGQGAAAGDRHLARGGGPLPARGPGGQLHPPPEHRRHLRVRPAARWPPLLRDGAARRHRPVDHPQAARPAGPRRDPRDLDPPLLGARGGPRRRRRAPRPQGQQRGLRPGQRQERAQAARLRHRQAAAARGRHAGAEHLRHPPGDPLRDGARADPGRARRSPGRHLFARRAASTSSSPGRYPFSANSVQELDRLHLEGTPPRPSHAAPGAGGLRSPGPALHGEGSPAAVSPAWRPSCRPSPRSCAPPEPVETPPSRELDAPGGLRRGADRARTPSRTSGCSTTSARCSIWPSRRCAPPASSCPCARAARCSAS